MTNDGITTRLQKEMSQLQQEFLQLDSKLEKCYKEMQTELKGEIHSMQVDLKGELCAELQSIME